MRQTRNDARLTLRVPRPVSTRQTIVRAREQLVARRPTKSDWAEEDKRAKSPPAQPKPKPKLFSPRVDPATGAELVKAKRMSGKDVREADAAESKQKERAAALKVKPSSSGTNINARAASSSGGTNGVGGEGVSQRTSAEARGVGAAWGALLALHQVLVMAALLASVFILCVALDQRGMFPDVMTSKSMRSFVSSIADACTAANMEKMAKCYVDNARGFGARLAIDAMALGHAASAKAVVMHDVVVKHGETAVEFVKEAAARATSALKR